MVRLKRKDKVGGSRVSIEGSYAKSLNLLGPTFLTGEIRRYIILN